MLRKFLMLSVALLSVMACQPIDARAIVDVDLVDRDTGQWLPEYAHRGRIYVPGEPGHRYAVRLTNQTGERVLVVLSVDGVNAVSGEDAHPSQAGYVLGPWQSTEIAGWRKSMDEVAQFYFTDLPDSYAARTGRPDNVGVVGIAVFRERMQAPVYRYPAPPIVTESRRMDSANEAAAAAPPPAPSAQAESSYGRMQQKQRIGTGHGQREWSQVSSTQFTRASSTPDQVVQLRYDDARSLIAMGVLPRPMPYQQPGEPRAFPGFVADPPSRW